VANPNEIEAAGPGIKSKWPEIIGAKPKEPDSTISELDWQRSDNNPNLTEALQHLEER
jgi:hypothetical protein